MNDTPTPSNDEWGTISKEDGHWSSHKRRERWIKTVPLKTSEELQTELAAVTEQRDEYKAALQSADNHNHEIATKLEIVTEQRDRLAEAIRKHKDTLHFTPHLCDIELYYALQSLNQKQGR